MSSLSSADDKEENPVFQNEKLKERILEMIVRDEDYSAITQCRLVNSSWNTTITSILTRNRQRLFRIDVSPNSKLLEKFETLMLNSANWRQQFPPFEMRISKGYMNLHGLQGITETLSRIGVGLVKLELDLLMSMNVQRGGINFRDELNLPNLQDFKMCFRRRYNDQVLNPEAASRAFGANKNLTMFIQSILSSSNNLERYFITGTMENSEPFPLMFERLRIPNSVTEIKMTRSIENGQLIGLAAATLPKLTSLTIPFGEQVFKVGLVVIVLEKFSETLKHLTLIGLNPYTTRRTFNPNFVCMPTMKCLETFNVLAWNISWSKNKTTSTLDARLPTLKSVKIANLSLEQYRNLFASSSFESVAQVSIDIDPGIVYVGLKEDIRNLLPETLQTISTSYPNIKILELLLKNSQLVNVKGLRELPKRFALLQELRLEFSVAMGTKFDANAITAELLDIPLDIVTGLSKCRYFWDEVMFKYDEMKTIVNMKELKKMSMSFITTSIVNCDFLFFFGLMRMPKLKSVGLGGSFRVSRSTADTWRSDGRMLGYYGYTGTIQSPN